MSRKPPEQSRLTLSSSIDMIYKLDARGRYTYINQVMETVLGKPAEEMLGKYYLPLVRQDFQERVLAFYTDQVNRKLPTTYYEFPLAEINDRQMWVGQTVEMLLEENELKEVLVVAHDITERVLATHLAANSEEKYRNIIENINLGLMEVDLEDIIVYANQPFCRITGFELSELIGKPANELYIINDSEDRKRIEHADKLRAKHQPSANELKLRRKDGRAVWVIVAEAPIHNSRGEVIGSVGIHNDITERKYEELQRLELLEELEVRNEDLRQKQSYLSAINDFASALIRSSALQDIVNEIIANAIHKFGFQDCVVYLFNEDKTELREIRENGQGDIKPATGHPKAKDIIGQVASKGKAKRSSYKLKGETLSELAVPIITEGEVIGVIHARQSAGGHFTIDHQQTLITISNLAANRIRSAITKQKRMEAEMALKESESKLRSIIESALDAVINIDENGIVTEWNPQAKEIFGYSREETMGKDLAELIIPHKYRDAHNLGMKYFLKTGEGPVLNQRFEIHGMHKTGYFFPVELSISPIKLKGSYIFSAFVRDITLKKQTEDDMETALQKQKELSELKSRLISMTSHEFRTPLTTIKSSVDLLSYLLEKEKIRNREKLDRNFSRVNQELGRLNNMINDILMVGRMEAGQVPFRPDLTDVVALCRDLINQSFSQQADKRQVEINVIGEKQKVLLDENIFTHIISNLISNAFKYSQNRGNPKLNIIFTEEEFRLEVIDRGIGIPEEEMPRLFESFYRASNSGHVKGNGMGLAIVKQFVEMHNARIEVESILNEGSKFMVINPYNALGKS